MIQQYIFQQMHSLIFIYDKLDVSALQHNTRHNEQEETLFTFQILTIQFLI
jgi:hypothetical protein